MEEKKCPKCRVSKSTDNFSKCRSRKDGLKSHCKQCSSADKRKYYQETIDSQKEYRDKNKDKYREYSKNYYEKNKERIKEVSKRYYENNKDEVKNRTKKYNEINKNKIKKKKKRYREDNKDIIKDKEKKYYQNNKDKRIEYQYRYKIDNKDKCKKWQLTYRENNKDKIYQYKLRYNEKNPHIVAWRNLLKSALYRLDKKKEDLTIELLGYSSEELRKHIESLFTIGMSWENYGEWHIDHIRPISSFDPGTPTNVVCDLNNLQPLWATTREIDGIIYEGNLNKYSKFLKSNFLDIH